MKPTLVVLAAGMGSRYGSLKQMDGVGPNGEAIIDYSIYDAVRAGFGKVVFIIRHSFEKAFREIFTPEHFGGKVEIEFVFQELDYLPEGFSVPEGREKPWGTCHAVMMAAPVVDARAMRCWLTISALWTDRRASTPWWATTCTIPCPTTALFPAVSAAWMQMAIWSPSWSVHENTVVSMNLFGFTPDFFAESETLFKKFLSDPANMANPKAEFFIPLCVNQLINDGKVSLKVLNSDAQWFGVTYKQDRPYVVERIQKLIEAGVYPEHLWK